MEISGNITSGSDIDTYIRLCYHSGMKTRINKEQDVVVGVMYLTGMSAQQIADSCGVYKQSILNSLKRRGIERRKDWKRASGSKNGNWKGGIRMIKGYRHVYRPDHRLARKDGWISEHRLLKEDELTDDKQIVHHKDGNRLNNNTKNLIVIKNNGVHRMEHCRGQERDKQGRFK